MPIRNPFARRPGPAAAVQDENQGSAPATPATPDATHPGFERVDTVGSKASSAFSIRSSRRSQDTGEYKMSVVNDSGVYLPPSPVEREAAWPRRYLSSRTSSDLPGGSGSGSGEIEHFPISRESFDSYRRSFDITARTPLPQPMTPSYDARQRMSLDSHLHRPFLSSPPRTTKTTAAFPRSSLGDQLRQRSWGLQPPTPPTPEESETGEEDQENRKGEREAGKFEEVRLNDDAGQQGSAQHQHQGEEGIIPAQQQQQAPTTKKRGFFAKFGSEGHSNASAGSGTAAATGAAHGDGSSTTTTTAGTVISRFLPLGGGRKRAQSGGQGAELGFMPVDRLERNGGMQAQEVQV